MSLLNAAMKTFALS